MFISTIEASHSALLPVKRCATGDINSLSQYKCMNFNTLVLSSEVYWTMDSRGPVKRKHTIYFRLQHPGIVSFTFSMYNYSASKLLPHKHKWNCSVSQFWICSWTFRNLSENFVLLFKCLKLRFTVPICEVPCTAILNAAKHFIMPNR